MVYKGLNQELTPFLNNLFSRMMVINSKIIRLGVHGSIYVPRTRLKLSKGNIQYRGPTYYNQVPSDIREAKNDKHLQNTFKEEQCFQPANINVTDPAM